MTKKDKTKLICLVLFIAGLITVSLIDNRMVAPAYAFASGPEAGHTGAPLETTCATSGCHTAQVSENANKFLIEAPSSYQPGTTYQITVRHINGDSSRQRWGFQITALASNNSRAGDLQHGNSSMQILTGGPGGNRQYIEHASGGSFSGQSIQASWTFNWTAPSSDVGRVTLYAAGNQANNNGAISGDQIYVATATINSEVLTGPPNILNASVSGKKLFVLGENLANGATLYMCDSCSTPAGEGEKVKKVSNDSDNPNSMLVAKKAGKDIDQGQTVMLQVKNPDGTLSNVFSFSR